MCGNRRKLASPYIFAFLLHLHRRLQIGAQNSIDRTSQRVREREIRIGRETNTSGELDEGGGGAIDDEPELRPPEQQGRPQTGAATPPTAALP
ncbi:hypothetical protein LXL04_026486 [Taraxacum kok-saghyz]